MKIVWSVEDVVALRACYSEGELVAMSGGRRRMRLSEIAQLPGVSVSDRLWFLRRAVGTATADGLPVGVYRAVWRHARNHPATADWAASWLAGEGRTAEAAEKAEAEAREEAAAWAAAAAGGARAAAREAGAMAEAWAAGAAGAAEEAAAAGEAREAERRLQLHELVEAIDWRELT